MSKSILFITDRDSITTKTLMTGLISRGFSPIPTALSYSSLPNAGDCPPAVFCCLQDWHIDRKYLYSEILRLVKDSGSLLFLGIDPAITDEEEVVRIFRRENVADVFLRPFNINKIAERIGEALKDWEDGPVFSGERETEEQSARRTVLIVDDNPTSLRTLKNVLQSAFKVYMADSGVSALKFLEDRMPDIILLDYEMPVINGPQFLSLIRERRDFAEIPVIFLTGKSSRDTVREVMSLKPAGYLLKSTPTNEIIKKLNEILP